MRAEPASHECTRAATLNPLRVFPGRPLAARSRRAREQERWAGGGRWRLVCIEQVRVILMRHFLTARRLVGVVIVSTLTFSTAVGLVCDVWCAVQERFAQSSGATHADCSSASSTSADSSSLGTTRSCHTLAEPLVADTLPLWWTGEVPETSVASPVVTTTDVGDVLPGPRRPLGPPRRQLPLRI